ncbi:hypothetical protein H4Q26_007159 [Puccinia striiformis f. sp. tritici PST-130]|nr:hypothetical protein H4Q26_007159 [Puccinia striiformis f. sp. tritici PST-130]
MEHRQLHPKSSIGSFQVPISPKQPINLPTTSTSYLAVILAGPGEGLFPLINNQPIDSDEPPQDQSSKAALPLLNRPIIEFILEWIDQSGLTDILILASESQRTALNSIIKTRKINTTTTTTQTIKVEFIPDVEFLNHGTSGSLRWAIQRNLIEYCHVIYISKNSRTDPSSSLKCSQVDQIHDRKLISIVERHRTHQNLITSVFYERQANTLDLRDGKTFAQLGHTRSAIGDIIEPTRTRWIWINDGDKNEMIDKCPTSVLSSSLVPAHVFVCSPAVIDLLIGLPQLASFKHQFVPWLAKNQWQPGLLKKTALASTKLDLPSDPLTEALLRSSTNPRPSSNRHETVIKGHRTPLTATSTPPMSRNFSYLSLDARVEQFSHQSLSHGTLKSAFDKAAPIKEDSITPFRCEYVLWIATDGFVCRANSVPGYAEINRTALKLDHERVQDRSQTRPSGPPVPGTGTAGADSLLGSNVTLADKSSVKKSIVGKNCSIGKSSKILNSILMEKVTIGEHVKIENCILTNNVVIGDRVELKDCEVEAGTVIEADFITKGKDR